ncbi:MAG: hypothetical protein AAF376_14905 [Pseudomonadota bacterium]
MTVLRNFLSDEAGAVTVDYVMVTAGVVGIALASVSVVSGGVEGLSGTISDELSDMRTGFQNAMQTLETFDFTDGERGGWSGGRVRDMGGELGELLVIERAQAADFTMEVPEGTELAMMSFDLIGGDSLDNTDRWGHDIATLMINDTPVAVAMRNGSRAPLTIDIPQVDGTTVEATIMVEAAHLGGNARWQDSSARVTVAVEDPTADINFQLQADNTQNWRDEFWGIDNFETSVDGATGF